MPAETVLESNDIETDAPGRSGEHQADRRWSRIRFPPPGNSSRPDCLPLEPQNS